MNDARDTVLARIRGALGDGAGRTPGPFPEDRRRYAASHTSADPGDRTALLAEHLADYRAHVHRTTEEELPSAVGRLLAAHGSRTVVVPPGLPEGWLAETDVEQVHDSGPLTAVELDAVDSVLTGCVLAIAETGTIVLDSGPGQGRRALSLVPDHHVCVIRAPEQVVASVPEAVARLDPARPQTWISGPSATSDIELDRVEGVHGPRTLDVVIVGGTG